MNKALSEKIYFSLIVTDFDYIAVRHLMAGAFFPSAGALANITIDRYIKTFLWSMNRDDLVDKIKGWGGNKSHNISKMIVLCKRELGISLDLNKQEQSILKNIYECYCFRYIDVMFKTKGACEIRMNYMHTIDKICAFFRGKTQLIPPHQGKTIIDILLKGDPKGIAALSTGNVNLREVLLADNPYFNEKK